MPTPPSAPAARDEPVIRERGDACPGALRLHAADDGYLARVRIPGGMLGEDAALLLADAADRLGDGHIDLTSRGNAQLRGLGASCGGELAGVLDRAGLLPAPTHERVRNIVASPLTGLDLPARPDVAPWVAELDRLLCADPEAAALSGRFLFALDDGRGDVASLDADVTVVARDAEQALLYVATAPAAPAAQSADRSAAAAAVADGPAPYGTAGGDAAADGAASGGPGSGRSGSGLSGSGRSGSAVGAPGCPASGVGSSGLPASGGPDLNGPASGVAAVVGPAADRAVRPADGPVPGTAAGPAGVVASAGLVAADSRPLSGVVAAGGSAVGRAIGLADGGGAGTADGSGAVAAPQAVLVAAADAPRAAVAAARYFLDAARAAGTRAWRAVELPVEHALSAAGLADRLEAVGIPATVAVVVSSLPAAVAVSADAVAAVSADAAADAVAVADAAALQEQHRTVGGPAAPAYRPEDVPGRRSPGGAARGVDRADGPGPEPGMVRGPGGDVALSVVAPLGRLTTAQWRLLAGLTGRMRLTPWRGIVVPGLTADRAPGALAALADAGLVTAPNDPWRSVTACTGRPGCAKSLADVRADARAVAARATGPLPVHWSGCERRCGHPRGTAWVDLVATPAGYDLSAPGGPPRRGIETSDHLAAALASARRNTTTTSHDDAAKK
ncbi:hypothetical protein [Streptomyces sp. NPDC007369]|uniref:hypothetical protein n=1 Tax=Streptomyces sp. NPDC007369 TaxID=3154589 RepID=UPI0033D97018